MLGQLSRKMNGTFTGTPQTSCHSSQWKPGELSSWCISTFGQVVLPMAADKAPKLYRAYSVRSKIRAWTCITATLGVEEVMSSHRNLASWEFSQIGQWLEELIHGSAMYLSCLCLLVVSFFFSKSFWFLLHSLFASLPVCLVACLVHAVHPYMQQSDF